jgi:hypothetical protein
MKDVAQARELRLRLYFFCSECAHLIDLAEGNRQQREVEEEDREQHAAEEHGCWLEMLGDPVVQGQRPRRGEGYL